MTADEIKYLAKVAEWLETAPTLEVDHGEYYIQKIPVYFGPTGGGADSHDFLGNFTDEGGWWIFTPRKAGE